MRMLEVLYEIDRGTSLDDIATQFNSDSKEIQTIVDHLIKHNILEYCNLSDAPTSGKTEGNTQLPSIAPRQSEFTLLTGNSDFAGKGEVDKIFTDIPDSSTRGLGITGKLVTTMLLVSMIPILIMWISSYFRISSQLYAETEVLMKEKILTLTDELNKWVEKNRGIIYTFAKTKEIVSMNPLRQISHLKLISNANPWISFAFTLDTSGMNIARSDSLKLMDYGDRKYYMENLKGKKLAWQKVITKTDGKPIVVFSTPIRDQKKIVGVLGIAVDIEQISSQIAAWRRGESGFVFLLDDHYEVVAHQSNEFVRRQKVLAHDPLIVAFEKGSEGLIHFDNDMGIPSVGIGEKTQLGWILAVQQEKKDALSILLKERYHTLVLLFATLFLVLIISWFVGQSITRPLKKLSIAADRISIGDRNAAIDTRLPGELGELATSIARMNESIRLALIKLRNQRKGLK
jgi:methyl-accepting chemotaxis protein